jgi:hypothetical protein
VCRVVRLALDAVDLQVYVDCHDAQSPVGLDYLEGWVWRLRGAKNVNRDIGITAALNASAFNAAASKDALLHGNASPNRNERRLLRVLPKGRSEEVNVTAECDQQAVRKNAGSQSNSPEWVAMWVDRASVAQLRVGPSAWACVVPAIIRSVWPRLKIQPGEPFNPAAPPGSD